MQETTRDEVIKEIIQAYLTLGNHIRMAVLPAWFSVEMNLTQLKTIVLLEHHGSLTISELARLLNLGNSATSILVQQMVELELVERAEDSKDRRRTFVRPTARGLALVTGRRENIRNNLLRWLDQVDEEELLCLQRGLSAIFRVIRSEQATESTQQPIDERRG